MLGKTDFEKLQEDHQRVIFTYAYRLTGNREDALDLTQDTWIRVFKATVERERNPRSYLMRIMANLYKDRLRMKRRRFQCISLDDKILHGDGDKVFEPIDPHDWESAILDKVQNESDLQVADEILQRSFNEHEQSTLMAFYNDDSYQDIAERTKTSIGTIRSRLNRAQVKLRAIGPVQASILAAKENEELAV